LQGKKVYFVSGDLGGYGDAMPVIKKLQELGTQILFFADPAGESQKKLDKAGIAYETRDPNESDHPDLILIGVSATAFNLQVAWTKFGREKGIPVFWVEDMYATSARPPVRESLAGTEPNVIFAIDEIAASLAGKAYPGAEILACGKTSFEGLGVLREKKEEIRSAVRSKAKIGQDDFLVTFWSGGTSLERVRAQVKTIISSAAEVLDDVIIAPRFHPKLARFGENVLAELWSETIEMSKGAPPVSLVDLRNETPENIILASSITIGDWGGNESLRSIVLGTPAIVTLFPDDDVNVRLGMGYKDGIPPLVQTGAAPGPKNQKDLEDNFYDVFLRDGNPEAEKQFLEKVSPFLTLGEPGATQKIVEAIAARLG